MNLKFVAAAVLAGAAFGAHALPAISLPSGPLFIKFTNLEQIAINGGNTGYTNEINWGVLTIETLRVGTVSTPNELITSGNPLFFADQLSHNAQITGMFYDIRTATGTASSAFPSTGGYLDLYWRDLATYSLSDIGTLGAADLTNRTAQDKFTGFTEGTFLARIKFDTGIDPLNNTVTIAGDTIPISTGFAGTADSYGSVDLSAGGLWASSLNGDWFNSPYGQRDMRFKNSYNNAAKWNSGDCTGGAACVLGATSDDPAQAFAIPEPTSLGLAGLALLGLGLANRRRRT